MKMKSFLNLGLFLAAVLFSYATVRAQNTPPTKPTDTSTQPAKTTTTTSTSTNPRVVVTDNLNKPATAAAAQPKTSMTKYGNYSVSVTDNVTAAPAPAQSMENGKFFNVTTWDGTKWVTKRTWMPNKPNTAAAPKPNQ